MGESRACFTIAMPICLATQIDWETERGVTMEIGVIADTHSKMRPEALAALEGSDLILHAGDVGRDEVLEALEALAPLVAIRGNMENRDRSIFSASLMASVIP